MGMDDSPYHLLPVAEPLLPGRIMEADGATNYPINKKTKISKSGNPSAGMDKYQGGTRLESNDEGGQHQ